MQVKTKKIWKSRLPLIKCSESPIDHNTPHLSSISSIPNSPISPFALHDPSSSLVYYEEEGNQNYSQHIKKQSNDVINDSVIIFGPENDSILSPTKSMIPK